MKSWFLPSADSPLLQWLAFVVFLVLLCAALGGLFIWLRFSQPAKRKRKRRHHHHRRNNPTLAQAGGLPPKRDPDQPPPGP